MKLPVALVWVFYVLWIVAGLAAIQAPGVRTITVEPPGDPLFITSLDYDPSSGRLLFWSGGGSGGALYLVDVGSGEAMVFNVSRPVAGCVSSSLALAVWPLEGRILLVDGGEARLLRVEGAWSSATASCSGDVAAVLLTLGDRSLVVAYSGGEWQAARVPEALDLEVVDGSRIALALRDGLAYIEPGESVATLYPAPQGLVGLASSPEPIAVIDAGESTVVVAAPGEPLGLEVSSIDSHRQPRIEAVGPKGIIYARPPAGWARILCPTPSGEWKEMEAGYTRAYAFSRAGPIPGGGVWSLGVVYLPTGKAVTVFEAHTCQAGLAGWPETVAYLKPASPRLAVRETTNPLLPPQGLELAWRRIEPPASTEEPGEARLNVDIREAYVDWAMEAFTLASIGAAPAAAAHRVLSSAHRR